MKNKKVKPLAIFEWLIKRTDHLENKYAVAGDFEEIFKDIAARKGKFTAHSWYFYQVLRSLPVFIINYLIRTKAMFNNYLKIAVRNLYRHKFYSVINISGLTVGMACFIFILLLIRGQLSFDRFHERSDSIYRVLSKPYGSDEIWGATTGLLAESLRDNYPEIKNSTRLGRFYTKKMQYKDKVFFEQGGWHTEQSFLDMFSFPVIKGDPSAALNDPYSIVISEEMAERFFGSEEPVGKTILVDNKHNLTVTGVLGDIPSNSHLSIDFLTTFELLRRFGVSTENYNNANYYNYIQLEKGFSNISESKIPDFYNLIFPNGNRNPTLVLQPLTDIHFDTHIEHNPWINIADRSIVYVLTAIALFILIIACINFVNLNTARSANRAREIAMRKVSGAVRRNLIFQFFGESIILTAFSSIISVVIVLLVIPEFREFTRGMVPINMTMDITSIGLFIGIILITGLLSGVYPAILLSSFSPVKTLKGSLISGEKRTIMRKALVVFQFSLSVLLVLTTMTVYDQINYMKNNVSGLDRENVLFSVIRNDFRNNYSSIKDDLLKRPFVESVTASSNLPVFGRDFTTGITWQGMDQDRIMRIEGTFIDYDYFRTYNMDIIKGRAFSREYISDKSGSVILNEEAAKQIGIDDIVGKRISIGLSGLRDVEVIGIVRNYHFKSLAAEIEPLALALNPSRMKFIIVKVAADTPDDNIKELDSVMNKYSMGVKSRFYHIEDEYNRLYEGEEYIGRFISFFTLLAAFISGLGLLGLASFMAEQRTKEIGIRKVLGSSLKQIILLLSKDFMICVILANVAAWPAGWILMQGWLQGYANRTELGISTFMMAGFISLFIAFLAVSYQSIKAASANPAKSLRNE
ncbi:ABC transporter permease [candidate division KSB1 bacterium]